MSAYALRQLALRTTALVAVSATAALAAGCGNSSDNGSSGNSSGNGSSSNTQSKSQMVQGSTGKEIFNNAGCVSCHTLAAAGGQGNIGPNLDQKKPSKDIVVEKVTNGDGPMPSFKDRLTTAQINTVAEYVSSVAGQ